MLVPVPRFASLAEFNQEQLEKCDQDAEREHYRKDGATAGLHLADKQALVNLPAIPLEVSKYIVVAGIDAR
jgi:hypothetical protein